MEQETITLRFRPGFPVVPDELRPFTDSLDRWTPREMAVRNFPNNVQYAILTQENIRQQIAILVLAVRARAYGMEEVTLRTFDVDATMEVLHKEALVVGLEEEGLVERWVDFFGMSPIALFIDAWLDALHGGPANYVVEFVQRRPKVRPTGKPWPSMNEVLLRFATAN